MDLNKRINVLKIPNLDNLIVLKQVGGPSLFISTNDSFIITIPALATLLKFLLWNKVISHKVLESVLSEYYDYVEELNER